MDCLHLWEGSYASADFVVLGPRTIKDLICVVKSVVFAIGLAAMSLLENQESIKPLLSYRRHWVGLDLLRLIG